MEELKYEPSKTTTTAANAEAANPLDDPLVRNTLARIQISGAQLIQMSVKELNRRLAGCSALVVSTLKKCRRTLKNRGYAKNCRIKRIVAKNQLEQVNFKLSYENRELRQRNKSLMLRLEQLQQQQTGCYVTSQRNEQPSYVTTAECFVQGAAYEEEEGAKCRGGGGSCMSSSSSSSLSNCTLDCGESYTPSEIYTHNSMEHLHHQWPQQQQQQQHPILY